MQSSSVEKPLASNYSVLGFLYGTGIFLFEFAILGRLFSLVIGNNYIVIAAILIWKLGGIKGWAIKKCKEHFNERIVSLIENISNCVVYFIELSIWIFYWFLTFAWRLFLIIFFVTLAMKYVEYSTNQKILPF